VHFLPFLSNLDARSEISYCCHPESLKLGSNLSKATIYHFMEALFAQQQDLHSLRA
jgi:hypothetical protein